MKKVMKYWPVPQSYSKRIPSKNKPGSFWENRKDRFHCGVDIYASRKSKVVSLTSGKVIDTGIFTSSKDMSYWNTTLYVDIENKNGTCCRYAELDSVITQRGSMIEAGDVIGYVGQVLNKTKIDDASPTYIQRLIDKDQVSMLHFELYNGLPFKLPMYFGGNWFGTKRPQGLVDPANIIIRYK
jgi:murein DD-endopeptidase MepM/ murein hydrolase activator NlpD